jgi:PTH1 family peptidyl-tRNA hydrolase
VGLGNPGSRYECTRHNAGFMVIDELARHTRAGPYSIRCQSLICSAMIGAEPVLLAKPLTFMNMSGRAVQLLLGEGRVDPKEVILIVDDLNLPLGKTRIRERGSSGGHRGLESILRILDTDEIIRVRLGIGEENIPDDKAEFVLSDFPADRMAEVREMISRAVQAVQWIVTGGVSRAMSYLRQEKEKNQ